MVVFLDTNVLLDVFLERTGASAGRQCLICPLVRGDYLHIAWHTVSNCHYMMRHRAKLPPAVCLDHIRDLNRLARVVPASNAEVEKALDLPMRDFEDALQIAAAVQCGADVIVTRNTNDFAASPIPALTPEDFLAQYFLEAPPATP